MSKTKKQRAREKAVKLHNKRLVKQYPWLMPRSAWTGKKPEDYDYSYIEWGCAPGWDKAFGNMYLKELGKAVRHAGLEHEFQILEIKEKYGGYRLYAAPLTDEIDDVISKYEALSQRICVQCGKPDVPVIIKGWIEPLCFDCYKKDYRRHEAFHNEYSGEGLHASDDEIKAEYVNITDDKEPRMQDIRKVTVYEDGVGVEKTYDISNTAERIRVRYRKRMQRKERV